ncbi:MAG TPA: hypothetical protein VN476_09665 [Pyrinomonadaceae bacterium]|nr:hypothetical protein [Pyrinomonadaceae bacterium]
MLVTLAADAVKFTDSTIRARTLARVADQLWESDQERARSLFRASWDAAGIAEKEVNERYEKYQQRETTTGFSSVPSLPRVRREVLRLATKRDRSLGEEFLKIQLKERDESAKGSDDNPDFLIRQRVDVARQLLDANQIEQALQFADPVLGIISTVTIDFLSSLREKNAVAADERYAAMLRLATAHPKSDANTVSLLSSYLFTPHSFYEFETRGTITSNFEGNRTVPTVAPALQLAFFRAAAGILLRPLAPPGQEQNSAGHDGHYLVMKRLMPLFDQRAPVELTNALRARLDVLSALTTKATRDRDDDDLVREGIRPDQRMEHWEQSLLDQLDHATSSAERDQIHFQLAEFYAGKGELRARDYVDKIDDMETRNISGSYIDTRLATSAVYKKDVPQIMELIRTGQFAHLQKVRLLTNGASLLAKSEPGQALTLIDLAIAEARRIGSLDPDSPRAFFAIANVMLVVNRAAVWETMSEAVKTANSAENFGAEDGQLSFKMTFKGMSWSQTENVPEFDLDGIFARLADYDYDKAVELAQGLTREAPRAVATIAIARTILAEKKR